MAVSYMVGVVVHYNTNFCANNSFSGYASVAGVRHPWPGDQDRQAVRAQVG
jgi:hypothetical protein